MCRFALPLLFLLACDASDEAKDAEGSEQDADADADADSDSDTDSDTDSGPEPYDSTFKAGQYHITKLQLVTASDTDDDGIVDNNLPGALAAVDILLGSDDFEITAFNLRLTENLDSYRTIVLLDARHTFPDLTIDVLLGLADEKFNLSVDPSSYDESGAPLAVFGGSFTAEELFQVGPSSLTLPVQFYEDSEPLPITLEQGRFVGQVNVLGTAGELTGALPIDRLIEDVVAPLIPEDGYPIGNKWFTKDEVMDLIWTLAPNSGDVDLGGGRRGISCKFVYTAEVAVWESESTP